MTWLQLLTTWAQLLLLLLLLTLLLLLVSRLLCYSSSGSSSGGGGGTCGPHCCRVGACWCDLTQITRLSTLCILPFLLLLLLLILGKLHLLWSSLTRLLLLPFSRRWWQVTQFKGILLHTTPPLLRQ